MSDSKSLVSAADSGHELMQIQERALHGALEAFNGKMAEPVSSPAVVWAEAEVALGVDPASRTSRELELVHMHSTVLALSRVIRKGLVTDPDSAASLADVLVYCSLEPSSALKYLRGNGASKLGRTVTPNELVGALSIFDEFSPLQVDEADGEPKGEKRYGPSLATIFRAADVTGVNLANQLSEADEHLLQAAIQQGTGVVSLSIVEDDPFDGPVAGRLKHEIMWRDTGLNSDAAVNPAGIDDLGAGRGRTSYLYDFAELSGVDPWGRTDDDVRG